jgi:hypothetical protein
MKLAYRLEEAADVVPYSVQTLRRAIQATDPRAFPPPLKAKRDSRGYLILAGDLDAWLASLPDA